MKYDGFRIEAYPQITDAACKKCRGRLREVDNGWFSTAMFCPKCESVFTLKLIKTPAKNVSKDFLEQCRERVNKMS